MRAQAAETRHPRVAGGMIVEAIDGLPGFALIAAGKNNRLRDAGVKCAMREMQRPNLVDDARGVFILPHEVAARHDADMLGVAFLAGSELGCRFELLPGFEIVAGEDGGDA